MNVPALEIVRESSAGVPNEANYLIHSGAGLLYSAFRYGDQMRA